MVEMFDLDGCCYWIGGGEVCVVDVVGLYECVDVGCVMDE